MATVLNEFDDRQDALTVFLDCQKGVRSGAVRGWMEKLFDSQEYLYLKNQEMTGAALFQYIREKYMDCTVILPDSQRLVFCYYLCLNDLTSEWMEQFFARAQELKRLQPPQNTFDHYHVICYSYENLSALGARKDEVIRLLSEISACNVQVARAQYLLYASGFETLDGQEHGLAQLLHLLSRKDYFKAFHPLGEFVTYLKRVCYADYYKDRATACSRKIEELSEWLQEENDPEAVRLCDEVKMALMGPVDEMKKAIKMFRRRVSLYPVSVTEFYGDLVRGYKSKVNESHPLLQRRREAYIRETRDSLAAEVDLSKVFRVIEEEYHYPDYVNLSEMLESGAFCEKVVSGISNKEQNPDIRKLVEIACDCLTKKEQAYFNELSTRKEEKEKERRVNQRELMLAGKYSSLEDCYQRIDKDTEFVPMSGYFPKNVESVVLISGTLNYNVIVGVSNAFRYLKIEPYEIVVLKEGDLVNLTDKEAATQCLSRILS